jgi:hypothetical protein
MGKIVYFAAAMLSVSSVYAGERLSTDESKAFYSDTTIFAVHPQLGPSKTYFDPDGSVQSKSDSGDERVGKWWIDESSGKRCIRWNHENADQCHYIERNADGTHTLIHGKNGKPLIEITSTQQGNHL